MVYVCGQVQPDSKACLVLLLSCLLYSNQWVCIMWKSELSATFGVSNGKRQGSLLSSFFVNVYIADLLRYINIYGIGCNFGGKMINNLAYADDLAMAAPLSLACNLCFTS